MRVFIDEDLDKAKAHFDRTGIKCDVRRGAAPGPHAALQRSGRHAGRACAPPCRPCRACTPRSTCTRAPRALRMDHYQVLVPDVLANAQFYMDLGFRISDYLVVESARKGRRHLPAPQEQSVGHRVPARARARASTTAAMWSRRSRTSSGPATSPAISASGTARARARPPRPPALLLCLCPRSGRPPHRAAAARHPDHRHRRRAGDVPGQARRQQQSVGAAGAEKLGRGGDELRRRAGGRRRRRLADDGGAVPCGEEARRGDGLTLRPSEVGAHNGPHPDPPPSKGRSRPSSTGYGEGAHHPNCYK